MKIFLFISATITLIFCQVTILMAKESHCQYLWIDPISLYATPGKSVAISLYYDVTDNDNTLLGFGVRLFFDSRLLMFQKANHFFNTFKSPVVQPDTDDLDSDASTDQYVLIAWFEWNGRWPGERLPCFLGNIQFLVVPNAPSGIASLNLNTTATHPGYNGCADAAKIYVKEE
ncbi:MAG: hypothetical protein HQK75_09945 [Candidatus Magnetomorum sp.]|nr:hypothetical protein [Candidatus Magnetomorum sp.]